MNPTDKDLSEMLAVKMQFRHRWLSVAAIETRVAPSTCFMKLARKIFYTVVGCGLIISCLQTAVAQEPASAAVMYRADAQHSGVYPDSKAPRGKIKWTFAAGNKIRSTAALLNGVVYFGCDDGFLYALDSTTGKQKWKFKAAGAVSSSPAIYQNTVYIEAGDAAFHAVDANTGREKWTVKSGAPIAPDPMRRTLQLGSLSMLRR